MLTRSTFKRPQIERKRTVHQPIPEHLRRAVSYTAPVEPAQAMPKTEAIRMPALLEMARGRPCLLLVPGHNHNPDTVVAAHSNLSIHGKAGARKADDVYSVWACAGCHSWLDQGKASAEDKARAFLAAHARQVDHWARIAADRAESPKNRKAAQAAIDTLNRL
jgi:hypothetical protein